MNEKTPIVVPRYAQEDWFEWKSLCSDQMCDTWEGWNAGIEEFFLSAVENRAIVHAVTIRPCLFQEWAQKNHKPLNGYSRSEYAGLLFHDRFLHPSKLPTNLPKLAELNRMLRHAIKSNPDFCISDISEPYLRRPEAGVCPLFREDKAGVPEQFGSAVLIRIADHHFLISAAHVFDDFKSHVVLIPGRDHLVEMFGEYRVTPLPASGSREDDKIDVGYFHFKNGLEAQLPKSCIFLDEKDCHAMDSTSNGDVYTVIGYPAKLSKSLGNSASTEITRITCSGAQDHRYEKLGLDPRKHLLLQYRMKKGVSYKNLIPGKKHDFSGVSGGGVFAWSKDLPNPEALSQPCLVGIVTTYSPYYSVFLVTRLGSLLAAIRKEFPNLPIVSTDQ